MFSSRVPRMSETERQALEAGTVWFEGSLFAGRPDFRRLLDLPWPTLTLRERAFLDGPVETVCGMVDDWRLAHTRELPAEVWEYLKRERFFGLAIPEAHGGLGFSTLAQSTVFGKLASKSLALSAVVLIPSSVGPGELLLEYGTPEQQASYLPRLARGEEIPCFALTEPEAGSDAASLTSEGIVFAGDDGEPMIRLRFEKRYITLAPVATLLGLAFRLRDPDDLLGRGPEPGITVALVPAYLPGIEAGRRHDPMGIPFPNGPIRGEGVVIPASAIIGGPEQAGRGWKMLMEALSAGRSVSLPAQSAGGAKKLARVVSAYAVARRQFGLPIGRFEAIEERLAAVGGLTYVMEAARVVTCGALDAGHRPAVVSGIVKYNQTELLREVLTHVMDVLAGAALCRGPSNPLPDAWAGAPIGITVEGANILTRSLIVFGQGAVRCHPWTQREMAALERGDGKALARALLGHAGHLLATAARAALLGLSRGRLARSPVAGPTTRWYRRLSWASARFALLVELALFGLGAKLKRKEALSGRFADALSWLYLAACALKRFEAEGRPTADLPFVEWAARESLWRCQQAFEGLARNFEGPVVGVLMRTVGAAWLRANPVGAPPSDRLGAEVARRLQEPGPDRDRWTAGVYSNGVAADPAARLELAMELTVASVPVVEVLARAIGDGRLPAGTPESVLPEAIGRGVVTGPEARLVRRAAAARREAIRVDEFSAEEYLGRARPERRPEPAATPG